jgi:hypothetical protein
VRGSLCNPGRAKLAFEARCKLCSWLVPCSAHTNGSSTFTCVKLRVVFNFCLCFCRFQNDMADLLFVEKIARWLTNCQVKIKSEVADSNGQSFKIAQSLSELERLLIGCETPSLDAGVSARSTY